MKKQEVVSQILVCLTRGYISLGKENQIKGNSVIKQGSDEDIHAHEQVYSQSRSHCFAYDITKREIEVITVSFKLSQSFADI